MATQNGQEDCWDIIDDSHIPEFDVAQWIKITLALCYVIIFVAGILGNSITIRVTQVLQKKGYLQKEVTDHMVSLACSDLLVILLGMPVEFFSTIWSPFSTPKGDLACKLYCFLFEACSYATVLHVATLSFERYIAICHPFRFKAASGPCKVKILIAFVWITSVLVALPLLFSMGTEYPLETIQGHRGLIACSKPQGRHHIPELKANVTVCTSLSSKWKVFQTGIFTAFVVYVVVLASVAFMCRKMMKTLMLHKQGTLAVRTERDSQQQYLRKTENPDGRSSRKQTILFLGTHSQWCYTTCEACAGSTGHPTQWIGHCCPPRPQVGLVPLLLCWGCRAVGGGIRGPAMASATSRGSPLAVQSSVAPTTPLMLPPAAPEQLEVT